MSAEDLQLREEIKQVLYEVAARLIGHEAEGLERFATPASSEIMSISNSAETLENELIGLQPQVFEQNTLEGIKQRLLGIRDGFVQIPTTSMGIEDMQVASQIKHRLSNVAETLREHNVAGLEGFDAPASAQIKAISEKGSVLENDLMSIDDYRAEPAIYDELKQRQGVLQAELAALTPEAISVEDLQIAKTLEHRFNAAGVRVLSQQALRLENDAIEIMGQTVSAEDLLEIRPALLALHTELKQLPIETMEQRDLEIAARTEQSIVNVVMILTEAGVEGLAPLSKLSSAGMTQVFHDISVIEDQVVELETGVIGSATEAEVKARLSAIRGELLQLESETIDEREAELLSLAETRIDDVAATIIMHNVRVIESKAVYLRTTSPEVITADMLNTEIATLSASLPQVAAEIRQLEDSPRAIELKQVFNGVVVQLKALGVEGIQVFSDIRPIEMPVAQVTLPATLRTDTFARVLDSHLAERSVKDLNAWLEKEASRSGLLVAKGLESLPQEYIGQVETTLEQYNVVVISIPYQTISSANVDSTWVLGMQSGNRIVLPVQAITALACLDKTGIRILEAVVAIHMVGMNNLPKTEAFERDIELVSTVLDNLSTLAIATERIEVDLTPEKREELSRGIFDITHKAYDQRGRVRDVSAELKRFFTDTGVPQPAYEFVESATAIMTSMVALEPQRILIPRKGIPIPARTYSVYDERELTTLDYVIAIHAKIVTRALAESMKAMIETRKVSIAVYGEGKADKAAIFNSIGINVLTKEDEQDPYLTRGLTIVAQQGAREPRGFEANWQEVIELQDIGAPAALIILAIFRNDLELLVQKGLMSEAEMKALYGNFDATENGIRIRPIKTDKEEKFKELLEILQQQA